MLQMSKQQQMMSRQRKLTRHRITQQILLQLATLVLLLLQPLLQHSPRRHAQQPLLLQMPPVQHSRACQALCWGPWSSYPWFLQQLCAWAMQSFLQAWRQGGAQHSMQQQEHSAGPGQLRAQGGLL
jgi:hypothetical protein